MKATPQSREEDIVAELRGEIVSGSVSPGAPLPKRTELARRFGTSNATVQAAIERLAEQGFVEAVRGKGTYVRESLPHVTRYGLVVPQSPMGDRGRFSQFWRALRAAARSVEESGFCTIPVYDSLRYRAQGRDRLKTDLRSQTVGGLIFADCPAVELAFREREIPRVAIAAAPPASDVPAVYVDLPGFMDRAVGYLRKEGCRSMAVLSAHPGVEDVKLFEHLAAAAGIQVPPYWRFTVSPTDDEAVATYVHLLMSNPDHRPDGIVIADDNLVPMATAGLQSAGVRVPRDVAVVAETNFPAPPESQVPVKRLGFDITALVRTCVKKLQSIQHGEKPQHMTYFEALFEEELQSDRTAKGETP